MGMKRETVWENPDNPPFETLPIRIDVPILNLRLIDVAKMYSWCNNNCSLWNIHIDIDPYTSIHYGVTFAFEDELEAVLFKLVWL